MNGFKFSFDQDEGKNSLLNGYNFQNTKLAGNIAGQYFCSGFGFIRTDSSNPIARRLAIEIGLDVFEHPVAHRDAGFQCRTSEMRE